MDSTRRTFLKGIGAATAATAGIGQASFARAAVGEPRTGGTVRVGNFRNVTAEQLNPLRVTDTTETELLSLVYDQGVLFDSRAGDFVPWAFESVSVDESAVGTDEPVVTATLREGQTFTDGVPVTAEDVAFTVRTIRENDLDGEGAVADLSALRAVRAADDRTVEYTFDEPLATFRGDVLGLPILPAHRWREFDPASTDPVVDGLVGSGPFEVDTLDIESSDPRENRVEYVARDDYVVADAFEGLGGPFVDRLEFEFFPGTGPGFAQLEEALQNREVDIAAQVRIPRAGAFQSDPCFTFAQNPSDGYVFLPYNTRRRPFDDPAFRRVLSTVFDTERFATEVLQGFGVAGDYAVPPVFSEIRPQAPGGTDRYDYPRTSDGSLDVQAARDLFRNADSDREYTFGPVVNDDLVTGDRELRIDGQPLTEFHTDTDGTPGEGPIEFLEFNQRLGPAGDQWVSDLQAIGVPIEGKTPSFGEVFERGFVTFDYDVFQIELSGVGASYSYLSQVYDSEGSLNAAGYGAVDDQLAVANATFDETTRESQLRDAVSQIYADQPTLVAGHADEISPIYREFTDFVASVGNVVNKLTFVSLRRAPAVAIDVKPGSEGTTPINAGAEGVTPVAVRAGEAFDPADLDVSTVRCGGANAVDACEGVGPVAEGAVTEDGDRVFRFPTDELGVTSDTESLVLFGELDDGGYVRGEAEIRVVG